MTVRKRVGLTQVNPPIHRPADGFSVDILNAGDRSGIILQRVRWTGEEPTPLGDGTFLPTGAARKIANQMLEAIKALPDARFDYGQTDWPFVDLADGVRLYARLTPPPGEQKSPRVNLRVAKNENGKWVTVINGIGVPLDLLLSLVEGLRKSVGQ